MKRPILWTTIFMICGIYMRLGISKVICLVSFLFLLFFMFRFVINKKKPAYLLLLFFVPLGFFSAGVHWQAEQSLLTKTVTGEGVILEEGETTSGNQKLTLRCSLEKQEKPCKVYAVWIGEERFQEGERVAFSGEIVPFSKQSYPGGYDEQLYLLTKGYEYKLYPEKIKVTGQDTSLSVRLARARAGVQMVLDRILPAEESGLMQAVLTGDKEKIPEESYTLYSKAGVVHVLCISGLHLSILALYLAFFLEKALGRSKRTSALVTIFAVFAFLLFIKSSPSSYRAALMITVVLLGRAFYRLPDALNTMAIAAFLLLLFQPLYLFHAGFQLSFLTVFGIWFGIGRMERKKKKDRGKFDWLKESLLVSLYASLFSYPAVAYYFSSVSLVGIFANLLIVPLSGLLLGFGLLSVLLGAVCLPAGIFAAGSVYAILQAFKIVCTALVRLPFAYVLVGCPSYLSIVLYYVLLFFVLEYGGKKGSWKVGAVLSAALFCAVFENPLFRKENTIAFLDVGQGDAAVISTYDGAAYLVDGGGKFGQDFGENVGKRVVLPYLEYLGVSALDGAFLSHPDSDHMTGLLEVLETLPTKGLYLSDYAFAENEQTDLLKEMVEKYNIPLYTIKTGDSSLGDTFLCLYPTGASAGTGEENQGSMVLRYSYSDTKVLFTGDITAEEEQQLLAQNISADVLKVAHHGSKYSSDAAFLEKVSPKAAVISCGTNNVYGHPHKEAMERLQKTGAEIFRTDEDGTILVTIGKDGAMNIETMTERKPLYENIKEKLEKS